MAPVESSITARSLHALKWNYAGVAVRVIFQLIAQISLARLLGPETFGTFALAFLVVGLGGIVIEMGLGSALVQQRNLREEDIRLAYTRIAIAGVIAGAAIYFLANIPATFFDDERIAPVLRWLVPAFLLQGFGIVPLALLKRNLDFRAVQTIQMVAYIAGYLIVGIGCALLGADIWSLVAAITTTNLIVFAVSYALTRPPLLPLLMDPGTRLPGFGAKVALTNVSNWIIENIDNLLIGKLFGAGALGLYSVSYNLVRTPTNHLVVALQTVLFPATSRAQDDPDRLRRGYVIVASAVAIIAFPLFTGIAAVSGTVIETLFGTHWANASGILVPLALAMTFHAVMAVAGPVLWGMGRPGVELKVQAWVALLLVAVLLLLAQFSLKALAWGVFAVYGLRTIWITVLLGNGIHIPLRRFLHALRGGLLLAASVAAVLVVEAYLLQDTGKPAPYCLGVELLSAAVTWIGLLLAAPRIILSRELAQVVQRVIEQIRFLDHSPLLRRIQAAHRNISA